MIDECRSYNMQTEGNVPRMNIMMDRIKYNIISARSARDTVCLIAEKYDSPVGSDQWDVQCAHADLAALTDKWSLDETIFFCVRFGNSSWFLHPSPKDMEEHVSGSGDQVVDLAAVYYKEIASFDYDTLLHQGKFKNYEDRDSKAVLINWAKVIAAGNQSPSIPVTLIGRLPSSRIRQIKLSHEAESEAKNA